MPAIREQTLNRGNEIIRIVDAKGEVLVFTDSELTAWRLTHPAATPGNLTDALYTVIRLPGCALYVHVYSFDGCVGRPELAVLITRPGMPVPPDWWEEADG